jgi:pyruvate,water dikinase
MDRYVLDFEEIDRTQVGLVGGKGVHLGELSRIADIRVPPGFCVTTDSFRPLLADAAVDDLLDGLSRVGRDDHEAIRHVSAQIRRAVEAILIPPDVAAAITGAVTRLGEQGAFAVRSSATAEDLATASSAGQYDTYLNVIGSDAVLRHVRRCWASLFTERAVTYRLVNGVDHRSVLMAVVAQRMVSAEVAGTLFTADPVTSNRLVTYVEASFGLGEAVVSGRVQADVYQVRGGAVIAQSIGRKQFAVEPVPAGGTREVAIEPRRQEEAALTDPQILSIERLGRVIEAHLGGPQDIEWCLVDDGFQIVQSRPITTLFPIPEVDDDEHHVYVSVGHQQMMTDPMKPLGLSFWMATTRRPMFVAGGRLFVDVARELGSSMTRATVLDALGRSDPLIGAALRTVVERDDFVPTVVDEGPGPTPGTPAPVAIETDPDLIAALIERSRASVASLQERIRGTSGPALMDLVIADIEELRRILFDPDGLQVIMAAMEATWWLNEQLEAWLEEKGAADVLTQSVPHNVTAEMGLALLDVADAIRPRREVVTFLEQVEDEGFLDELPAIEGGREARDAIRSFLDTYGMRGTGEIDITRSRWGERPTTLVPLLLGNVRNFEPGEGERRFEQGRREAEDKERELLERLAELPEGERKVEEARRMVDRVRTFSGYREYPKYGMVTRYFIYKRALLAEAGRLVEAGRLRRPDDIFYLTLEELHDVVRTGRVDHGLVDRRREAFASYGALTPPRVLTSDGEVVTGTYTRDDVPAGALVGLAVSAGTVEGRARVVLDLADAELEPGDILVTTYTDPSWTPTFVVIAGLVTEVGGLMTHGSVIAREYGLPAVVGVEQATRLISDGQRIRLHGTDGYVEILDRPGASGPAGSVRSPPGTESRTLTSSA